MAFGLRVIPFIFPCRHVTKIFIVTLGLMFFGLVGFIEVTAAGFFTFKGIHHHQFGKLEEIGHPTGTLKALIEIFVRTRNYGVLPELFPKRLYHVPGF